LAEGRGIYTWPRDSRGKGSRCEAPYWGRMSLPTPYYLANQLNQIAAVTDTPGGMPCCADPRDALNAAWLLLWCARLHSIKCSVVLVRHIHPSTPSGCQGSGTRDVPECWPVVVSDCPALPSVLLSACSTQLFLFLGLLGRLGPA